MAKNSSFRDLIAWQKAMTLVEQCYSLVSEFPRGERFELGAQLRRTAVSIPSNIAEGQRLSRRAFRSHLRIALASEAELQTQLELAGRLRLADTGAVAAAMAQSEEVACIMRGLLASVARSITSAHAHTSDGWAAP